MALSGTVLLSSAEGVNTSSILGRSYLYWIAALDLLEHPS